MAPANQTEHKFQPIGESRAKWSGEGFCSPVSTIKQTPPSLSLSLTAAQKASGRMQLRSNGTNWSALRERKLTKLHTTVQVEEHFTADEIQSNTETESILHTIKLLAKMQIILCKSTSSDTKYFSCLFHVSCQKVKFLLYNSMCTSVCVYFVLVFFFVCECVYVWWVCWLSNHNNWL